MHDRHSHDQHVLVQGLASPDDPDLAGYWENRRRKHGPPLDAGTLSLLGRQHSRCPRCEGLLIDAGRLPASPEEWEQWWLNVTRQNIPRVASAGGDTRPQEESATALVLMHVSCHRAAKAAERRSPAMQPATP